MFVFISIKPPLVGLVRWKRVSSISLQSGGLKAKADSSRVAFGGMPIYGLGMTIFLSGVDSSAGGTAVVESAEVLRWESFAIE